MCKPYRGYRCEGGCPYEETQTLYQCCGAIWREQDEHDPTVCPLCGGEAEVVTSYVDPQIFNPFNDYRGD